MLLQSLEKEIEVKLISDKKQIANYGVSQEPAVIAVNYKLKSEGIEPSLEVIKEWIKEL